MLHASFADLRSRCTNDTRTTMLKLKDHSSAKCMTIMEELYKKSQTLQRASKLESAYIALRRCLDVGDVILNNSDYVTFKLSADGKTFHRILSHAMADMKILDMRVREIFSIDKLQREEAAVLASREAEQIRRNSRNELDDTYIRPQQLVGLLERGDTKVLLLDYRSERSRLIHYTSNKFAANVQVVVLNPLEIPNGCILSMLASTVGVSDRPILLNAAGYDLVVLVGDEREVRRPVEEMPRDSATKKLIAALTTYNNSRVSLKRAPLILEEGFQSWYFAYPMYTRPVGDDETELSFDDKFGRMLIEASKVTRVDVSYPHLFGTKDSHTSASTTTSKRHKKDEFSVSSSTIISAQHKSSFSSTSSSTSSAVDVSCHLPSATTAPPPRPKAPPSVDRSTKPTPPTAVMDGVAPVEDNIPIRPADRNGHLATPQSCAAAAGMLSDAPKSLPVVATLGGARTTPVVGQDATAQPPVPDRAMKTIRDFTQRDLQYFNNTYEASIRDICEKSKPGPVNPGYTGLYNMRNTCFMNATLQALFNTPAFASIFMDKRVASHINVFNKYGTRGVISGAFSALMDSVWSGRFAVIRPSMFLDFFVRFVNESLGDRCQHDAQEFQIYLLDALHEDTNKINVRRPFEQNYNGVNLTRDAEDYIGKAKLFSSSVISDFFNLRTVSQLSCTNCQTASVTFEEMNQISLELPSTSEQRLTSLRDCLYRHFEDIVLEGWNCPTCKAPRMAGRSSRLWTLPPVFIVHMKRFSCDGAQFVKNEIDVGFDVERLSLADFVHEQAPRQNANYFLYAVTNHSGRLNSGHYTALARNLHTREWLRFDDECVTPVNASAVQSSNAFILYFTNLNS